MDEHEPLLGILVLLVFSLGFGALAGAVNGDAMFALKFTFSMVAMFSVVGAIAVLVGFQQTASTRPTTSGRVARSIGKVAPWAIFAGLVTICVWAFIR